MLCEVPKTENELLKFHLDFSFNFLNKKMQKYYFEFLLLERQDLKTLSYIFLKETWERSLKNKNIQNFRSYLSGSLKNLFMTYARKCHINPEDRTTLIPEFHDHFYAHNQTPESFARFSDLLEKINNINLSLSKNEKKALNEYFFQKCNSLKEIALKNNVMIYKLKYLIIKIRKLLQKEKER
ncbi:RNA polymerase sigma factor [Mycoplasmoides alvi]|uniref:sigma-70 family RNA polymerase sigma factor n=1 Tax=Mycoplasmoides alvi TaxID=78580 RepID=UPI00051BC2A5|nr:sigma-70 family RNA polymerase sigma factor [Mycoplasmoides alvi]